jgi:AsmA protein
MDRRRKTGLIAAGISAILLLALVFIVPVLINVDRYRPRVISYLQQTTGKQVEIGRLALTFFPIAIHIDHFGVKNPPIFPAGYVVQVARIDAELSVRALLRRELVVKSLVLEEPVLKGAVCDREPRPGCSATNAENCGAKTVDNFHSIS